ncbi:MAG: hypothetical protein LBB83_05190 [Treponema sp.]|nr:hypothetical protein [Treponema sp.]
MLEAYYAEHPGTRERVERFLAMAESDEGLLGMARVFNALEADGGDTPARQAYRKIFGAKNWDVLMRKAARGETITARDRERLRRQLRYAPLVYTDAWAAVTGDPSFAIPVPEETALPHDDSLAVFMRNDAGIVAYSQQFASPEEFQTAYEEWDIIIKQPEGMQEAAAAGKFYKTIWEEGRKLKAEPAETVETGERGVEDFLAMVNSETGLFSMVRDLRGVKEGLRDFQPDSAEEGQRYTAEKRALDTVFGGKNNNWNNAMIQADRDGVIHSTTKTFIRGQVRKNPLPYMEAWAVVTGDDSWLAGEADKGKYSRLDAGDDLEGMTGNESPEERRRIARRIAYEGVEEAIANGTLKPDDPRLDDYEEELRERQKQGQAKIARKKEDLSDFQWHIEKAEANIKKQQLLAAGLADDTTREGLTKTRKQEAGVKQAQNDLLRLRKEYAQWAASLDAMGRKNLAEFRELLEEQAETEESLRAIDDFRKARIRVARELLRKPDSKTIRKYERDIIRWIQGRFPALYESLPKFIGPKARSVYEMVAAFFSDETYRTKIQTTMSAENYKKLEVIIWSNKHKNERRPYDKMTAKQRETLYNLMVPWEELHLFGIDNIEDRTQNQSTPAQEKWVREQLEPLIPPHIMAKLENFQGLETYTMEELETLAEAVRGLRKKGWDELRIRNDARKQFYEAYQDAFGKIIRDSFKGKVKGRQLPGTAAEKIGDEEASRFKKLLYLNTNARRFVRMLEGGTDGLMYDVITEGEDRAYYQQMTRERERRERVAARLKEAGIDPRVLSRHTFEVAVDLDGKGIKTAAITLDEGLSIRRAALNERAYRAVMFGNFGTVDERTAALEAFERMDYTGSIASLARAESRFDAAKKQIDAFLAEHPELTKVEEILGQDFDEHYGRLSDFVADEFNQDLGSESYYMPLIRLEQNGTDINQENVDDVFAEAGIKQYISRGFTRGRIDVADFAQQPVKLGLYKLWDEAVTKQEHLMAYAPHLREMRGIFQEGIRSKQLMNDIRERYSIEGKKYIDNYISTLANPNPQKSYNNLDGINRLVRGHYPTAVLAFRVSSIIKQAITSPPPFFQAGIGVMEYTAAAMECLNPDTRRMIVEKSLFMYSRVWEPAVAAMKQMEKMSLPGKAGKVEAALTTVEKIGMEGLSWIDRAAVFPGWLAAYRKKTAELSRNKTMTEELIEADAVRYADRVVRDSQPSNRTVDLAPLFQGDRGGAFGQFFLQFQVPMSVIFQNIFIDAPNNFKNGRIREGVTTIAVYALTAALVGILEEDEDDEKLNPKYRGIDAATGMLESIPVVGGSIAYSVEGLLRTGKMGMSGFRPFPVIESGVKGINGITQGEWGKALDGAIEMFGYWASLPVGAKREWQRAIKERDPTILLGNK